jgi:hypothetical protein
MMRLPCPKLPPGAYLRIDGADGAIEKADVDPDVVIVASADTAVDGGRER